MVVAVFVSTLAAIVSAVAEICASCVEMQYVLQIHSTMSKMTQSTKGTLKKRPKARLIHDIVLTRNAEPGNERNAKKPEASQSKTDMAQSY